MIMAPDTATSVVRWSISATTDATGRQQYRTHISPYGIDAATAKKYAYFRFRSLRVTYTPVSGSNTTGAVYIAFYPNCENARTWDASPATDWEKQAYLLYQRYKIVGHCSTPGAFNVDAQTMNGIMPWKPCSPHAHAGEDTIDDPGYLVMLNTGSATTALGIVMIEAMIEYRSLVDTHVAD